MAVAGLKMLFSNAKKWASAVTSGQFTHTVNQSADWSVLPLFNFASLEQKSNPACVPIPPSIPIINFKID